MKICENSIYSCSQFYLPSNRIEMSSKNRVLVRSGQKVAYTDDRSLEGVPGPP